MYIYLAGMETPESLQLRKKVFFRNYCVAYYINTLLALFIISLQDGTGTETPDQIRKDAPRSLYTVLEQKQVH